MKKIFGISPVTRKKVKGDVCFTAIAFAKDGTQLGKLEAKTFSDEGNYSLFIKYVPNNDVTKNDIPISKILAKGAKQEYILTFLKKLVTSIPEKIAEDKLEEISIHLLLPSFIGIFPELGEISIGDTSIIHITNDMICQYLGEEWIGFENQTSPEFKDFIEKFFIESDESKPNPDATSVTSESNSED